MKKYSLDKEDYSRLHFELQDLASYYEKNEKKLLKPHKYDFFQLLLFKTSGDHYVDYEVISHKANTLFLINQEQIHHFCKNSSNEGLLIHFNNSFISNFCLDLLGRFAISIFNEIDHSAIQLEDADTVFIENTFYTIKEELHKKKGNHSEIVTHLLLGLLYYVERIKNLYNNVEVNTDLYKIVHFKKLIIKHIDEPWSVERYSKKLNISTKKLTSLTKKHTTYTPAQLIKKMKILEAKRLLSNHNVSISQIAFHLGFDQPTYFTKFFKKETSFTPKQFQELY